MTKREKKIINLARIVADNAKEYQNAEDEMPVVPQDDDDAFEGRYQGGPADDNDPSETVEAGIDLYNAFHGKD